MRKIILSAFTILGLLASCKTNDSKQFTVQGSLRNNPGKQTVYLDKVELTGAPPRTLDTMILTPGNPEFSLKAPATGMEGIYRLRFEMDNVFALVINDEPAVHFNADWKDFGSYTVSSPESNSFRSLLKTFNDDLNGIDSLRKVVLAGRAAKATDSVQATNEKQFRAFVGQTEDFLVRYADTTKSAPIALYVLGMVRGQASPEKLDPVVASLAKRFPGNADVAKVTQEYTQEAKAVADKDMTGKPAPDFTLPDTQGKNVSLSSFKGKYVLVDFWASWCGPCRQENPNVVKAYQKFKDRNFTILGVSLDQNKDAWLKAIKDDGLAWTQVSDLKYWNSAVVPLYGIEGIPFNVLLDPQGKVIGSSLRGAELDGKLAEVLK
jgi:peroxiredoxin